MEMFLDSADLDEIRHALEVWDIDGITTNPKHVASAGRSLAETYREIAGLVADSDRPVSVEVDPHLTDTSAIVEAGLELSALSPNFVIKVGVSESGLAAIRQLNKEGVRTNATLVFTVAQAWHAARAGATYLSPFLGWREAHGDNADELIADIRQVLAEHGYPSLVIAAAIRNAKQIADAALAGADCLTAGFSVYHDSFQNPYTDKGHQLFGAAWDSIEK